MRFTASRSGVHAVEHQSTLDVVGGIDRSIPISSHMDSFDETVQASMEEHIPDTNRGYTLLCKMGWGRGSGIGRRGGGIIEPVRLSEQHGFLGLGKWTEDEANATAATEHRKAMTSELIAFEDEAAREAREAEVAKQQSIADAVSQQTSSFYCDICDKQYVKVTEYENHLSSYDHHHKKRFREMQARCKMPHTHMCSSRL